MSVDNPQRKLVTILAADFAGFSRLTAKDEEATFRTLGGFRQVIDRLIARHEGRIFNTAGDSVLAEFNSAVEAVRCATTIQEELRVRNAELVPERQMLLRIGINVGDVLVDGTNLFGDGVNVAARLESIAEPGGICISGSVFALVRNKLSYGFEDIGPQSVKNIPEPVPAFRLLASAAVAAELLAPKRALRPRLSWKGMLAVSVVLIFLIGTVFWLLRPERHSAPPPFVVSPSGPAAPVAGDFNPSRAHPYVGMKVHGVSRITGRPFTMSLEAGGKATNEIVMGESGQLRLDTGVWSISETGSFCYRFEVFGAGKRTCLTVGAEGPRTYVTAWINGKPERWYFSKSVRSPH